MWLLAGDTNGPVSFAVYLAVAAACSACGCKKKESDQTKYEQQAKPSDMSAGSAAAGSAIGGSLLLLSVEREAARDPRAADLMKWVVPLEKGSTVACSSTEISDHALLTAAHCVDGHDPAIPAVDTNGAAAIALDHRACAHGLGASCNEPFPVGSYDSFDQDIATIWLDDAQQNVQPPELGHLNGGGMLAGAFMLSARAGAPHAVCRARVTHDVGEVEGSVELGDSGSAIVAFNARGTPVIVGVVSHRWQSGGEWYFAMIPNSLPWPAAASVQPPSVAGYYDADFTAIEDCQ